MGHLPKTRRKTVVLVMHCRHLNVQAPLLLSRTFKGNKHYVEPKTKPFQSGVWAGLNPSLQEVHFVQGSGVWGTGGVFTPRLDPLQLAFRSAERAVDRLG